MKASSGLEPPSLSSVSVESKVGILIEIRFIGSPSMDEVVAFEAKLLTLVRRIVEKERKRAVLCTDLRACQVLGPEVSDRIAQLMRNDNPYIARNAFLEEGSALLGLQVQRFLSETGGQSLRRMFTEESALVAWLSEVTTIPEQTRLRTFLNSNRTPSE